MSKIIPLLLILFTLSFLIRSDNSFDQDLGRHIKLGEIILRTKTVPLINLFSYTYPDFPFINSHWLFEVFVFLGRQTVGLQTILFLKIAIILLSVWLTLSQISKKQYLLLPVGFIFLHLLRERPDLRPEIFSFLFTSLTIYILNKQVLSYGNKQKYVFFLPIIQLIWVNTHIYFIVGIFLQLIFLIHYAFLKEFKKIKFLSVVFFASILFSLINPSGIKGFLNPFLFNSNYGYTIVENQNLFLLESINFRDPNFLFAKLAALICLVSLITAFLKKRLSIKNLGLVSFGLVLAFLNVRSFPYLIFISLPAVLENFGSPKPLFWTKTLIFATIPLLFFESFFYLNGDYYKFTNSNSEAKVEFKEDAKKAMDFVLENNLPTPIFNNFDIGSYITYRGYPKYGVFVDGRPGEYPKDFFSSVYIPMQSDMEKFKKQEKIWGFKTIIFSHTDQTPWGKTFLNLIDREKDWSVVYLDDTMVVYLKTEIAGSKGIQKIDLNKITPDYLQFDNHLPYLRLSLFLANAKYMENANLFYEKALSFYPKTKNIFFW